MHVFACTHKAYVRALAACYSILTEQHVCCWSTAGDTTQLQLRLLMWVCSGLTPVYFDTCLALLHALPLRRQCACFGGLMACAVDSQSVVVLGLLADRPSPLLHCH
jgi:hypothetical protein